MAGLPVLADQMKFIGVDPHTALTPTVPPLPTIAPHLASESLKGVFADTFGRIAPNVLTPGGRLVLRGSDVGPLIIHVPLSAVVPLLAVILATSTSKSQFGVSSVRGTGASLPVAVAVLYMDAIQQNCGDVAPFTGAAIGVGHCPSYANTTVLAGFTFADFAGSLTAMIFESASTYVLNKLFGVVFKKVIPADEIMKGLVESLIGFAVQLGNTLGLPPIGNALDIQEILKDINKFTSGDDAFDFGHDAAEKGKALTGPLL